MDTTPARLEKVMLKINYKAQNSNWNTEVSAANMQEAVEQFRIHLTGLYTHSGGYVQIVDTEDDMPVIEWKEEASGGYVCGQAVIDYKPDEELDVCENDTCEAHSDDNQGLCEACEIKCREICLDYLLRDNQ